MKKKFYCVGNAHLDPAWMWCWQEGSAEAKATIRSALDRMKEYPEFKFVCAGVSVFEWIEEFCPSMFEEVKERVKEGRFVLVGGWYVQPDCNIPSGEGFARQSLYSQRYFYEKFGVTAKTGYNVDSFGHNLNIPMIMQKSGMKNYIFMRPQEHEKHMTSDVFYWESPDGSRVLAYRIADRYCHRFIDEKELLTVLEKVSAPIPKELPFSALFYGVGNHGGGPTKRHIELLQQYEEKNPGSIVFSSLNDMFEELRNQDNYVFLTHTEDLQHHASGCYSAFFPIKKVIREGETGLVCAEMLAIMARSLLGKKYKTKEFREAWKDILFIHFHDICGGCCVKDAYKDALAFGNEAIAFATKQTNNAVQSISWAIDTHNSEKGIPVVVFNPHPFPIKTLIRINLRIMSAHDEKDNKLPIQFVTSQTLLCSRRTDSLIRVEVPACGYATYYINRNTAPHCIKEMAPEVRTNVDAIKHFLHFPTEVTYSHSMLEDSFFRITFDTDSGYVRSVFDKKKGRELIAQSKGKEEGKKKGIFHKRFADNSFTKCCGAVPVVIDESSHDTWSHGKNYFNKVEGYFTLDTLYILERGPLRASIKVVYRYKNSTLIQIFTLANDGLIRVHVKIDWHEKQKMLKIGYPFAFTETSSQYEIPFGYIYRPTNGEEECGQMYCAITGKEGGVAMLNDSKYSFSVNENTLFLTAIRSPYFGDHGFAKYATEETDVTDQGECEFNYALCFFDGNHASLTRKAKLFNTPPTVVIENNHEGVLETHYQGIEQDCDNFIVSCLKRSEDGTGLILRAYETDGKETKVTFSGALLPRPLTDTFTPYTVNTYLLVDGETKWKKVLLTEMEEK